MPTTNTIELDGPAIKANARELGPDIEAAADTIARERRLPSVLVESMRNAGLFRIAFPRAWGGPEMDPLQQCELMETLAYHDASVAWVAMICSDSGHFAARVEDSVAHELYPSMDLLTAGNLGPVGQAHRENGGFRISGRWPFGSGCLHADRMTGGCTLFENGAPVLDSPGMPAIRQFWLPKDKVEVHDTWYTTGLAGSGSNDYSVKDVFVPEAHSFQIARVGPRSEPLYRYSGFFAVNGPGVALGCAKRMIDDLRTLSQSKLTIPAMQLMKTEYRVQVALADATARLGAARAYQDDQIGRLWDAVCRGDSPTLQQRAGFVMMSVNAFQSAVQVAELVCDAAGSSAIYASSSFDRRRRDLMTMAAHIIAQRRFLQAAGRMLFGEDVGFLGGI